MTLLPAFAPNDAPATGCEPCFAELSNIIPGKREPHTHPHRHTHIHTLWRVTVGEHDHTHTQAPHALIAYSAEQCLHM